LTFSSKHRTYASLPLVGRDGAPVAGA